MTILLFPEFAEPFFSFLRKADLDSPLCVLHELKGQALHYRLKMLIMVFLPLGGLKTQLKLIPDMLTFQGPVPAQ